MDSCTILLDLWAWSAGIAIVSLDISRTRIFRPLRSWLRSRSTWLGNLIDCPWCLSHWVTLIAALLRGRGILDWSLLMGLSAVQMVVMCWLLWFLDERLKHDAV